MSVPLLFFERTLLALLCHKGEKYAFPNLICRILYSLGYYQWRLMCAPKNITQMAERKIPMGETETTHQEPETTENKTGRNVVFWGAIFAAFVIVVIIVSVSYGERMVICNPCEGTGRIPGILFGLFGEGTCTNCDGIGKIPSNRCEGCKGTGRDVSTTIGGSILGDVYIEHTPIACPNCDGTGRRR